MTITQISRASLLKDAKFGWDLVPLPAGPKGEYAVIGQAGLGVLKKGKNADAAADFLAFFTNPANSAKLAQFFPPPRTVAAHRRDPGQDQPAAQARRSCRRSSSTASRPAWSSPATPGRPRSARPCAPRSTRCGSPTPTSRPCSTGVCTAIKPLLAK